MPIKERPVYFGVNYRDSRRCSSDREWLEASDISNIKLSPGAGFECRMGRQTIATITGFPPNSVANSINFFEDYTGAGHALVSIYDTMLDFGDGTATQTTSKTGLTQDAPGFNVSFSNFFWYANGNENFKFDGTDWSSLGIPAPVAAPTTAVGIAGVLTGDYEYCYNYVYKNGSLSYESESKASAISTALLAVSLKKINVTVVVDPTGAASNIRIWRRSSVAAEFQLVVELANASATYVDNIADSALGRYLEAPYEGAPDAVLTGICQWKNRLFGWNGSQLYMTRENMPEKWYGATSDYKPWTVDPENNEPIIGAYAVENYLMIFTGNQGYVLTGDSETNFALLPKLKVGLLAPRSFALCGANKAVWLSKQGVMEWDTYYIWTGDTPPKLLSRKINTDFEGWSRGLLDAGNYALSLAVGHYNQDDQTYWLSTCVGAQNVNSRTFIYHYQMVSDYNYSPWSVWDYGYTDMAQAPDNRVFSICPQLPTYTLERIGTKDDGSLIQGSYTSRYHNMGTNRHDKRICYIVPSGNAVDYPIVFSTMTERLDGSIYTDTFNITAQAQSTWNISQWNVAQWAGAIVPARALPGCQESVGNYIAAKIDMKAPSVFVNFSLEYAFEGRTDI